MTKEEAEIIVAAKRYVFAIKYHRTYGRKYARAIRAEKQLMEAVDKVVKK